MTNLPGSCHCKRVRFEVDVDLAAGTYRCNCTSCARRRWWGIHVKPDRFRSLAGESELVALKPSKKPDGFCKHCGIQPYIHGEAAEWNDGDYVSINVAALDGLDPAALAAIPITYLDGLHDTWTPLTAEADTSYL